MTIWEESYVGQLRKVVGSRKLLIPAPRAFIRDDDDRMLFIRRRDNDQWGMPGGMMELDETIYDAMRREVREETGLEVISATLVAVYSGERFAGTDQWGNEYQIIVFQFRVDDWAGSLVRETEESVDAGFFSEDDLPEAYGYYREAMEDLRGFSGEAILK